jgi:hypothetical protein
VYEMTPWTCHALGEEARRLRYCLRTCAPSKPPSASMHAICDMYVGTALKAEGWEQSIDKDSMRVAGLSASMALQQLRSDVSYQSMGTQATWPFHYIDQKTVLFSRRKFNSSGILYITVYFHLQMIRTLSKGKDSYEGVHTICPNKIFW